MCRFFPFSLVLLALLAIPVQAVPTNVSTCQTINSGGVYAVNASLYNETATCLSIIASNVDLDCQGNSISSNSTTDPFAIVAGISAGNVNNVTIYNCRIFNFTTGILLRQVSNATVRNNTIWNLTATFSSGIRADTTVNSSTIYNNTIFNATRGIRAETASGYSVYNNQIYHTSNTGIFFSGGLDNNVTNNTIWNATGVGISVSSNENRTYIFNNTIYNITQSGFDSVYAIQANFAFNTTVFSNTVHDIRGDGVKVIGPATSRVNVSYNPISNMSLTGISIDSNSNYATASFNTIRNTSDNSIAVTGGSSYATVANNTILDLTADETYGFY
ncbi:right-handed parallel beta-helix repeat-containing protein [Candidatus Micrarchaeota archaeon]|nr:right-handed parallel beta-helix repeat-containing protein [Candidatus Micrarchaeota archaeon]